MKLKILFALLVTLFICKQSYCQENLLKKGNKIFILASDEVTKNTKAQLRKWKFWEVVENRKDADFIMKFYCLGIDISKYVATAEFIDPKTNETFKMTGSTYSTLSTSDAAEKLIYKQEKNADD